MQELTRVTLQNEMDLILAHKRSMRLAELAGLSLSAQTTFATAVSEVARNTIDRGKNGRLILMVNPDQREKYIIAKITDEESQTKHYEGLTYARRLVNKYNISFDSKETAIELYFEIPVSTKLDIQKLDEWKKIFRNEPAVSPYDELKRKNEQLQDLAQKLEEREQQYKMLTNALPIIIFTLNEKGELIYANEWLKRFTGSSLQQLNTTHWKDIVHPDDYDSFSVLINNQQLSATRASAIKTQCRLRHRNEDDYYWHMASISPLNDESGKLLYWIGYIVDINAQKLVEETLKNNHELKEAQRQLKENQIVLETNIKELNRSNQELQQFAYVASHDLQEPIRKISFYSGYLLDKYKNVLDETGLSFLSIMLSASKRMRKLINDLLAYSRVERQQLQFKPVSLTQIAQEVVKDLELLVSEKNATIQVDELATVDADEGQMHQLFENLIGNAIKYAKDDVPSVIHINCKPIDDQLQILVKDNGIGFDEKYLPQMFALFQRLHSSEKYEGTGLGLAICQKIVSLHNGKITAQSQEGEGATFIVTLPISHSSSVTQEKDWLANGLPEYKPTHK
ncbi:ATP-binding protein [Cytophagaceae bacterium YF14B1]|uniref:histidine kinase n=1 Tax=Xanthocytophaga flava TaxID=3048013 RepID=A0AAE3QWL9_9BACT|nr:ATP-binding protein [Xanthocytophaga flavus]MDJ1484850.1 ATP-binding protein [Xanthocytophaga flavus]